MSDPKSGPTSNRTIKPLRLARKLWWRIRREARALPRSVLSIGAMGATLALLAIVYLGYDLAKGRLSPCEAVYQQTSVGLKTRISFLKTEGEIELGREALTDLDERAQMAALNLKTCCTVLDAGRLDPEQFLQCKGSARAYEARIEDIADLVRKAVKDSITTGSVAASAAAPAQPEIKAKIDSEVAAAKEISRTFNREVVAVRKAQAIETLKATPPQQVTIEAQESEPNDDGLTTNAIGLGTWITGAIGAPKDADYFAFTTPETYRDQIRIELQNRSTTLEPRLELYDDEKTSRGEVHKTTQGADVVYAFTAQPATSYVVRVSSYYGENVGVYLMRVTAAKAYDAHEPNDDILNAKTIAVGAPVAAGIMDAQDVDYFAVSSGDAEATLRVTVQNRSTTLQPEVAAYDSAKALIGAKNNTTVGGDTSLAFRTKPKSTYYVRVRDYYSGAAGDYTLTVVKAPPGDG
jgi:hypothetical protein